MASSNPPKTLSPPPKFQNGTNPIIGPQTASEWADFWRWLFSQYQTVLTLVGENIPANSFPSAFPPQQLDNLPGSFPNPLQQQTDPGDIIAAVSAFMARATTQRPDPTPLTPGFPAPPFHTHTPLEIIVCTQATFPTLTSGSIPVFIFVSDYVHLLYWDGTTSVFCGDQSGCISLWESDPGIGYHLCDGSTVNRLNANGSTDPVTLEDLTSATNLAAFLEAGSPNSGPTAATAGTISGSTASALTGITVAPATAGSGAVETAVITPTTALIPPFTGGGAVTDPGHVHGTGSLVVSATGEPRKLVRRPYYRL